MSEKSPSKRRIGPVIWTVLAFGAGALTSSPLGQIGSAALDRVGLFTDTLSLNVCLPLRAAFMIIRDEDGNVAQTIPTTSMNETVVLITNNIRRPLDNVRIVLVPLSGMIEGSPVLLSSHILSTSATFGGSYEVQRNGNSVMIEMPTLLHGDTVIVESNFDRPIAYLLEISADGFGQKEAIYTRCDPDISITGPPALVEEPYLSEACDWEEEDSVNNFICEIPTPTFELDVEPSQGMSLELLFDRLTPEETWVSRFLSAFQ